MVKVADLINNMNDSVKISAMNIKNPDQTIIVYSNPQTGQYEFQLPQGDYQITYEGDGGQTVVKNLDLPLLNPSDLSLIHISEPTRRTPISYAVFCLKKKKKTKTKQ